MPSDSSCAFDSELYVCLTRAEQITSFEFDPNNYICTDCRSDLEEFSENCLDDYSQLVIRDDLNRLCGEVSDDAISSNEVLGEAIYHYRSYLSSHGSSRPGHQIIINCAILVNFIILSCKICQ